MPLAPHIVGRFSDFRAVHWQALDHGDNPFVSYAFLNALEQSGSITAESGWQPHHLAVFDKFLAYALKHYDIRTDFRTMTVQAAAEKTA